MELNLTAKDKHALKSLSVDLRDMLRMKKVDDMFENPEHRRVFNASFFQITEGNNLMRYSTGLKTSEIEWLMLKKSSQETN